MKKIKSNKHLIIAGLLLISILFLLNFVSAGETSPCLLGVSVVNQDPNPAVPNDYVDVVFQVSGIDNVACYGAKFEVIPTYPFSLDESYEGVKIINGSTWTSEQNSVWNIPYKIRVDKDALNGEAEITVKYAPGYYSDSDYVTQKIKLTIQDSRTNFDAVIQEVIGFDISIAIANTGKYTANSVVVRIPEQDYFTVTGTTDGQMVGNLDSGDYTIVGFTVSAKSTVNTNTPQQVFANQEEFEKYVQNQTQQMPQPTQQTQTQNKTLKFDVYYTDNIGERRIVNMELPLKVESNSTQISTGFKGSIARKTTAWYSSWIFWVIVIVLLILGYIFYKKGIFAKIFKKKYSTRSVHSNDKIPDWVKNSKEKK